MTWSDGWVAPRVRVISDNDYLGDPDGLVQLAHHLLCPTVDLAAVIGGLVADYDPAWDERSAQRSASVAKEVARLVGRDDVRVVAGANLPMKGPSTPRRSKGASLIVEEAMSDDTDLPLVVACGGSLTNVASAWLMEPRIAERLTVVWIGGPEYPDLAEPRHGVLPGETNAMIDAVAAHVVFRSDLPLWQVPRDVYSQVLVTRDELEVRMRPCGPLGRFLFDRLSDAMEQLEGYGFRVGDGYVLGDSPLVLLTALTPRFSEDPVSCRWVTRPRPQFGADGGYELSVEGAPVRVFTEIDRRAVIEDLFAKLRLHADRG